MSREKTERISETEEYELFGYPNTTIQDCNFLQNVVMAFARKAHNILDIACGTGRHALEMAKRGYAVTGVDISQSMLDLARKRVSDQGLRIRFLKRDICELCFKDEFDAAYILFNTMSLLTQNEHLIGFMTGIYNALRTNGLFIIEVGNLWSYIAEGNFSNSLSKRDEEKARIRRHLNMRIAIGPYSNVYCRRSHTQYWRNGRELQPTTRIVNQRVFSINELDLLCRLTKFQILEVFGSTNIEQKIEHPNTIEEIKKPYRSFVSVLRKRA